MRSPSIVLVPRQQNAYRWQVRCIMDCVPPNTCLYYVHVLSRRRNAGQIFYWVPPLFLLDNVKRVFQTCGYWLHYRSMYWRVVRSGFTAETRRTTPPNIQTSLLECPRQFLPGCAAQCFLQLAMEHSSFTQVLKDSVTSCVIDSEAVAWDTEKQQILPFQVLSTRKKKVC